MSCSDNKILIDARVCKVGEKVIDKEPFGIIVFSHTRKDSLASVLESLKKQDALKYTEVWIDGDQGKSSVRSKCMEVREVAESYPVKTVKYQRANFGFRKMILIGLLEMCRKYEDILVLEDDCFPTKEAISIFREELDNIRNLDNVFSTYGHHFLLPNEGQFFGRFQGWGWATTSNKLEPMLKELIYCYSMTEEKYLEFVKNSFTLQVRNAIEITPGRQPSHTFTKFFAWDETITLLCGIHGYSHKPTRKRVIYNFGMGAESTHFAHSEANRKPPFNLIAPDEVWNYF